MAINWCVFVVTLTCLLASVLAVYEVSSREESEDKACSCQKYKCGCCANAKIFKHKEKVCANIAYLPKEIGLEVTVTLNGRTVFSKKASAKNPPALCAKVPWIKFAKLCIRFYDLKVDKKQFSGCANLEAKLFKSIKVKLGCWKMHLLEEDVPGAVSLANSLSTLRYETWDEMK